MDKIEERFDEIRLAVINETPFRELNCLYIYEIETYRTLKNLLKDFSLGLFKKSEVTTIFNCVKNSFIHSALKREQTYIVYKQQQNTLLKISGLTKKILVAAENQDKEKVFDLLIEMFGKCQDEVSCSLIKERLQKND